ncbi:MAG: PEP-CTERM sorting domain-containing protein [Verrucomicrobiales bacterium]
MLDTLSEFGNAATAPATSGAGTPRGFTDGGSGAYTITAGGSDLWGGSDNGSFLYDADQSRTNFSAIVRQVSVASDPSESLGPQWGRTGLMARAQPATANAANVAMIRKSGGSNQVVVQNRPNDGFNTHRHDGDFGTANLDARNTPVWLQMHRYNDDFYVSWAPDAAGSPGVWSPFRVVYNTPDLLGQDVFVGLAHQAHYEGGTRTNTAGFDNFAVTDFDPNAGVFPNEVISNLTINPHTLELEGSLYQREIGTAAMDPMDWRIDILGEPQAGLFAEVFTGTNRNSGSSWQSLLQAGTAPASSGTIDQIYWANGGTGYPAAFGFASPSDQSNYSVRVRGQIFLPEPGFYSFQDGNDDYTFLSIGGETLVDDAAWTNLAGGGSNEGSRIAAFDATGIDPSGQWLDIEFRMAEGGGGDNAALYWDYDPVGGIAANGAFSLHPNGSSGTGALVPAANFRHFENSILTTYLGSGVVDAGAFMSGGSPILMPTGPGGTVNARLIVNGGVVGNGAVAAFVAVPEPSRSILIFIGTAALFLRRRR